MVKFLRKQFGKFNSYLFPKEKKIDTKFLTDTLFTKDIIKGEYIEIGDFTYGGIEVLAWDHKQKLKIGKYCSFARGVKIFLGGNHRVDWVTTFPLDKILFRGEDEKESAISKGDVIIENDVWVGEDVKILSGVKISNGAVIGAGSIVSKDVPPYAIVVGNPAKVVKYRFNQEIIESLLKLQWWDWSLEKIKYNYDDLMSSDIELFVKKNLNDQK